MAEDEDRRSDKREDRRSDKRTDVHWPVSVDPGSGPINGETVNISENGVSICCDEGVPLDQVVRMWIMPPDHGIVKVSGRVSWSDLCGIDDQDRPVGLGICFLEIDATDRAFFRRLVAAHTGNDEHR